MTVKQYSTTQRLLGQLAGLAVVIPDDVATYFWDTMEALSNTIEEVWKEQEVGNDPW